MTVQAATDGERILVRFPYSRSDVTSIKTVPGARWHPETKTWRVPLTMDSCRVLRRVFGADLEVMRSLSVWARGELEREQDLEQLRNGSAHDGLPRVTGLAPQLALAMSARPYQMAGAAWMCRAQAALLGDQPGLGKTLQTLATLIEADARDILVLCPRTATRTVWARETNRWAPTIMPFVAQGSRAEREQVFRAYADTPYAGPKMLVCNTEMMRVKKGDPDKPDWPFLHSSTWDAIVIDESHQSLATTKNVQSKGISQVRYGAVQLRRRLNPGGLAIALSGTPFRSNLAKSWGTLNWLRPDVFSSYWRFAKTHFDVEGDGYGLVVGREPIDQVAFEAALRPYYLARDKATVAPDLPPVTYAGTPPVDDPAGPLGIRLDMNGQQDTAYEQMRRMAKAAVEGGSLTANGVLAEITRLRQFANSYGSLYPNDDGGQDFEPDLPSNKLDWILEFLAEREGNEGKVVVASNFTRLVYLLSRKLTNEGYENMVLTGDTSDQGREDLVRRFADPDDKARVAIINMKAGGVAITLDAADDMILVDQPWTSDDEQQVVDRIHRVSRIHSVTVYRLLSAGTVDEWMASLTDEQRRILRAGTADSRAIAEGALR